MKSKPKVAVLLSGREPFGPYYGGALARWTYEVYRRLSADLTVEVFGFPTRDSDKYPLPHFTPTMWRMCKLLSHVPGARRYEEFLWLRALAGRIRHSDVAHIHNRPQWVRMLRQLDYRGTIILHLQNDHLGHWTSSMLDELALEVDAVVVCSQYLEQTFAGKSSSVASKTRVVFNGVDTELFHPREELRESDTILFVGRFDREKGVLQVVQAYQKVLCEFPNSRLVIAGATGFGVHEQTAYVREVRALLQSVSPGGSVEFPGYIHHDRDLPGWFQRATVFACPSLFQEPFGLVNAEAMACSTPVVGSNRGGIPEVVGLTGRLVDPENTSALASAISSLLSNPEERRELGRAACERARVLFDWSVIARGWLRVITEAVSSKQAARSAGRHAC